MAREPPMVARLLEQQQVKELQVALEVEPAVELAVELAVEPAVELAAELVEVEAVEQTVSESTTLIS